MTAWPWEILRFAMGGEATILAFGFQKQHSASSIQP
jgi:hypothetical protein